MIAEILSTGDEIRTGAVADTNAAYIAAKLEIEGFFVARHTCVGDDKKTITAALKEISDRCDFAVVTGGLGPTVDDLTAEAAACAVNTKLIFDKDALENIKKILKSINRDLNPSNKKQAMLPETAKQIYNHFGTAPGFIMKIGKATFFFLPGVPFEMKKMLETAVEHIKNITNSKCYHSKIITIKTFGKPESEVNELLLNFSKHFNSIKLGLRAIFPEIHIKLYAKNENLEQLEYELKRAEKWIMEKIGKYVFSKDGSSMQEAIAKLLIKNKATIAVAESCTGGLISNMLTNVSGSSAYFLFSGVTYSNESKINILGVSENTIKKYGAVSVETAKEMAIGAKRVSGSDYAISTSGIAGPTGGTIEKPVGTVCIGIATPEDTYGFKFNFIFKERLMNKKIFAVAAIDRLRRILCSSEN
jgi:nicotinamide-nucleotide amidase